jgi:hypothetical protein
LSTSHQNLINNLSQFCQFSQQTFSNFSPNFQKFPPNLSNFQPKKALSNFLPKRKQCQISRQKESLVKFPAKKKALSNFPPKRMPCQISRQKESLVKFFPPKTYEISRIPLG